MRRRGGKFGEGVYTYDPYIPPFPSILSHPLTKPPLYHPPPPRFLLLLTPSLFPLERLSSGMMMIHHELRPEKRSKERWGVLSEVRKSQSLNINSGEDIPSRFLHLYYTVIASLGFLHIPKHTPPPTQKKRIVIAVPAVPGSNEMRSFHNILSHIHTKTHTHPFSRPLNFGSTLFRRGGGLGFNISGTRYCLFFLSSSRICSCFLFPPSWKNPIPRPSPRLSFPILCSPHTQPYPHPITPRYPSKSSIYT